MRSIARFGSVLVVLAAVTGACKEDLPVGSDGNGDTAGDGGTRVDGAEAKDGGSACVTIEAADYPRSCTTSSDCTLIPSGSVCNGSCGCGEAPVNASGEAEYRQAVVGIEFALCGCPEAPVPECVDSVCVVPGQLVDGGAPEDGGSFVDGSAPGDGGSCVDINAADYPTACTTTSDCATITSGTVCNGDCDCGGTAVNTSGEAQFQAAVSDLHFGECGCPAELGPQCINNVCVIPGFVDGGAPDDGGGSCIEVDAASYPTACSQTSDCVAIPSGNLCTGGCACPSAVVNQSGEAQYESATSGLSFEACPCPSGPAPACVNNICVNDAVVPG